MKVKNLILQQPFHLYLNFVKNYQKLYNMGECATIDEMLVSFRGRCKFQIYIPNKHCKCGIKIMALIDSKTHYFLDGYIYIGRGSKKERTLSQEEQELSKPTQSVVRLSKPIFGSNRNTTDNWFTSINLAHLLAKKGLIYVGALKNKNKIPAEFLPNKTRPTKPNLYGFTTDLILVSYIPKKQKAVLLVSSMHHSKCIDPITNKPEIIMYYNSIKGGVDALEKCTVYCTR